MSYQPVVHKLLPAHRRWIDEAIVEILNEERLAPIYCSASALSVRIERQLGALLPPRPDSFYRYVDQGLQRLRRAGRIHWHRLDNGQVVWRLTEST